MTETLTTRSTTPADLARRANRLFLASFAAFVGLVIVMIVGLAERQTAQDELAQQLDVELNDIPPAQLADVIRETWNTPAVIAIALLALTSMVLFSHGVRAMGGIAEARGQSLTRVATVLPFLGVTAFFGLLGAEWALAEESAWLVDNWWVWNALLTVFVLCVTVSLVLMVVRLRPTRLAPRTTVVVLVLAALVALLTVTSGVPPILPILLAAVFAFNVRRAAAAQQEQRH